jgi:hypothetical protein
VERLQERIDAAEFARLMEFLEVCPPAEERMDWLVAAAVHRVCTWIAAGAGARYEAAPGRLIEWERDPREIAREREEAAEARFAAGMEAAAKQETGFTEGNEGNEGGEAEG